ITANLELVSKLLGQFVHVHDVRHTSVLLTPDYIRLRQVLVAALKPFPAAAVAVGAALARLEQDAAEEVKAAAGKHVNGGGLLIEHQAEEVSRHRDTSAEEASP